jgi:hypothetical protein
MNLTMLREEVGQLRARTTGTTRRPASIDFQSDGTHTLRVIKVDALDMDTAYTVFNVPPKMAEGIPYQAYLNLYIRKKFAEAASILTSKKADTINNHRDTIRFDRSMPWMRATLTGALFDIKPGSGCNSNIS